MHVWTLLDFEKKLPLIFNSLIPNISRYILHNDF